MENYNIIKVSMPRILISFSALIFSGCASSSSIKPKYPPENHVNFYLKMPAREFVSKIIMAANKCSHPFPMLSAPLGEVEIYNNIYHFQISMNAPLQMGGSYDVLDTSNGAYVIIYGPTAVFFSVNYKNPSEMAAMHFNNILINSENNHC